MSIWLYSTAPRPVLRLAQQAGDRELPGNDSRRRRVRFALHGASVIQQRLAATRDRGTQPQARLHAFQRRTRRSLSAASSVAPNRSIPALPRYFPAFAASHALFARRRVSIYFQALHFCMALDADSSLKHGACKKIPAILRAEGESPTSRAAWIRFRPNF